MRDKPRGNIVQKSKQFASAKVLCMEESKALPGAALVGSGESDAEGKGMLLITHTQLSTKKDRHSPPAAPGRNIPSIQSISSGQHLTIWVRQQAALEQKSGNLHHGQGLTIPSEPRTNPPATRHCLSILFSILYPKDINFQISTKWHMFFTPV